MHTYFQDFTRDDGSPVTVEYSFGDHVEIISVMPNTPEFEALCTERLKLEFSGPPGFRTRYVAPMNPELREKLEELDREYDAAKAACALTDAESERMEDWLFEHHVDDQDDDLEF